MFLLHLYSIDGNWFGRYPRIRAAWSAPTRTTSFWNCWCVNSLELAWDLLWGCGLTAMFLARWWRSLAMTRWGSRAVRLLDFDSPLWLLPQIPLNCPYDLLIHDAVVSDSVKLWKSGWACCSSFSSKDRPCLYFCQEASAPCYAQQLWPRISFGSADCGRRLRMSLY